MSDGRIVRLPIQGGGPPNPPEGLSARVTRVEARIEEVARRLEAIESRLSSLDTNLGRLPSKEFLATTVVAVGGISLAAALAFAALTFNIADYAAKNAPQNAPQPEQSKASANPSVPQPIVIVVPSTAGSAAQPVAPPPGPSMQKPQPQ